jgi:hypothetical protein
MLQRQLLLQPVYCVVWRLPRLSASDHPQELAVIEEALARFLNTAQHLHGFQKLKLWIRRDWSGWSACTRGSIRRLECGWRWRTAIPARCALHQIRNARSIWSGKGTQLLHVQERWIAMRPIASGRAEPGEPLIITAMQLQEVYTAAFLIASHRVGVSSRWATVDSTGKGGWWLGTVFSTLTRTMPLDMEGYTCEDMKQLPAVCWLVSAWVIWLLHVP